MNDLKSLRDGGKIKSTMRRSKMYIHNYEDKMSDPIKYIGWINQLTDEIDVIPCAENLDLTDYNIHDTIKDESFETAGWLVETLELTQHQSNELIADLTPRIAERVMQTLWELGSPVDNAYPTCRLIPWDTNQEYEEWEEVLNNGVVVIYLFNPQQIKAASDRNPSNPAENLPWDWKHVTDWGVVLEDGHHHMVGVKHY